MKYKCLIFDHDDTTVNSTATIHYPSFVEWMAIHRPNLNISLEEYVKYNFEPGVIPFFKDICGLNDQEMDDEEQFWYEYAASHYADAFEGIKEIMEMQKAQGGYVVVASHSLRDNILKDYKYNDLPIPDMIFGWEQPKDERKPSPIPVLKTLQQYSLKPEEVLVIDDLKPGYDMARAAGVDFAAAGWCFDIEENRRFLEANSDYYCETVEQLKKICFEK